MGGCTLQSPIPAPPASPPGRRARLRDPSDGSAPEQPTTALPRHPDAGRFPVPSAPAARPDRRTAPTQPADSRSQPATAYPAQAASTCRDDQRQTDPTFDRSSYYRATRANRKPQTGRPAPPSTPPDRARPAIPADTPRQPPAALQRAARRSADRWPRRQRCGSSAGRADRQRRRGAPTAPRTGPRKLTVTRVAAFRSRELTTRGVQIFQRAATADGADRSGLTHLTYAVMGNYAVDAALAVALANTLFFAAATAESTSKVLLYLLITVAPFAVIAPLIGPALDKLQHGRRIALGASSFARALLAIVMALNFDSWILYPVRAGHAGAVEVVQRAEGGDHPAGAAAGPQPGEEQLPADGVRPAGRRRGRRDRGRAVLGVRIHRCADLHRAAQHRRRPAVPAHPGLGGVDRRRDPRRRGRTRRPNAPSRCR